MTSSLISRELDSVNLDGISRLLSNLSKQVGRNQSMSRAEAVSLDRERQSLKNRYTSILVDLDFRFTRLKEVLVSGYLENPDSEALGGVEDFSKNPQVDHLLNRAKKLAAAIEHASEGTVEIGDLKNAYRKLVRRYNALVKTNNLAKRSDRDRVRARLVDIAHQFRRVEKAQHNRGP